MGFENRILNIVKKKHQRMNDFLELCTMEADKFNTIDITCPSDFIREQLQIFFDTSCPWQLRNATFNIHV